MFPLENGEVNYVFSLAYLLICGSRRGQKKVTQDSLISICYAVPSHVFILLLLWGEIHFCFMIGKTTRY
jgi:hypothetical protein